MLPHNVLIAWATIIACASAFHPYFPAYRCTDDGDCPATSKRAAEVAMEESRSATNSDAVTFKLKRRISENKMAHSTRLRSTIDKIRNKYKGRGFEDETNGSLVRKSNAYTIDASTTPTQENSAAIDQDGTDFSYFAVVDFGSNETPMYLLMDTGASSTWVMGTSCTSTGCQNHDTFGAANSSTYLQTTSIFSVSYGTGSVSGVYASDSITFAGLTLNMTFGVATTTSSEFSSYPMDGIMGLARTAQDEPTVLEVITNTKILKSNIFGISIDRASDGAHDGEINFGTPDTSRYSGSLSYTSLANSNGDWVINADDFGINNKKLGVTGRAAYIDTGTSYIFVPPADAKTLHDAISGSTVSSDGSTWYVPCSTTTSLQFFFSGVGYSVSSKDWVGGQVGNLCTSNIYGVAVVGDTAWLLGDTFLKNVYTVFDADENRIGFGSKLSTSSASTTSVVSSAAVSASPSSAVGISHSTSPFASTSSSDPTSSSSTSSNTIYTVSESGSSAAQSSSFSSTVSSTTTHSSESAEPFNAHVTSTATSVPSSEATFEATSTAAGESRNSATESSETAKSTSKDSYATRLELTFSTLSLLALAMFVAM